MKGLVQFEKRKLQCSVFGIETQLLGFYRMSFLNLLYQQIW